MGTVAHTINSKNKTLWKIIMFCVRSKCLRPQLLKVLTNLQIPTQHSKPTNAFSVGVKLTEFFCLILKILTYGTNIYKHLFSYSRRKRHFQLARRSVYWIRFWYQHLHDAMCLWRVCFSILWISLWRRHWPFFICG